LTDECRVTLSFSHSCPSFVLPWLTITFCINALFFHSRSNGLATDIVPMAPGHGWHGLELRFGTKELRKNGKTLFWGVHSLFLCGFCRHCAFKKHHYLAHFLWTLPLILLATAGHLSPFSIRSSLYWISQSMASPTYS
jgi:hypothetical protein